MEILNKFLSAVDRIIGGIPKRNVLLIRQIFFTFIFVGVVAGLIYGIVSGKNAAHKSGIKIINETDDVFEIERRLERGDDPEFSGVTEAEYLSERKTSDYPKFENRTNERLLPESREFVVEADKDVKVKEPFSSSSDADRLAEIPHMDSSKTESEVTRVERTSRMGESKTKVIQKDKTAPLDSPKEKPKPVKESRVKSDENTLAPMKDRDMIVE